MPLIFSKKEKPAIKSIDIELANDSPEPFGPPSLSPKSFMPMRHIQLAKVKKELIKEKRDMESINRKRVTIPERPPHFHK